MMPWTLVIHWEKEPKLQSFFSESFAYLSKLSELKGTKMMCSPRITAFLDFL
jgi:hypothetical protein